MLGVSALWAVAVGLAILGVAESTTAGPANATYPLATLLATLSTMTVGWLLATRLPRNVVGWLLLAGGMSVAINSGFTALADYGLNAQPGSVPGALWFAIVAQALPSMFIGLLGGYVPLYFPTGRLPSKRWWPVPVVAALPTFVGPLATLLVPLPPGTYPAGVENPLAVGGGGGQVVAALTAVSTPVGVAALVCVVASVAVRYRRSRGVERAQVKWFSAAAGLVVAAILVAIPTGGFTDGPLAIVGVVAWLTAILGMALVPLAIGVAVLRYRLYEIDRVISRTIGWAIASAAMGAVFVGAVLVIQAVLAPVTSSNTLAVAASTLVVAGLFQPLRRRVQQVVDRRFNRSRYDAERTVAALARRLRNGVDLDQLGVEVRVTVVDVVAPASVSLWLRS